MLANEVIVGGVQPNAGGVAGVIGAGTIELEELLLLLALPPWALAPDPTLLTPTVATGPDDELELLVCKFGTVGVGVSLRTFGSCRS